MSDDPASANAFRWELEQEIERLRKERDEARQLYCGAVEKIQHGITNETKRSVADFLGWDCFKENTNG